MKSITENQFREMVRESIRKRKWEVHKRVSEVFDEEKQEMVKRVKKTTLMKFYCPLHCDWYAVVSDKETDKDTWVEENVAFRLGEHLEIHGIFLQSK